MFDETETIDGNPKSWAAWKREAERLQKIIDEMTTNNHPAHGPVSLDRLHQISEILSKAAAQSDGGNLGYAMADAVKVIDGAIAARSVEAIYQVMYGECWRDTTEEQYYDHAIHESPIRIVYTAPPAPVVPEWTNEQCLEFLSIAFRHAEIKGDLELDDIRLGMKMVNESRAAMLQAEPVSNSDELPLDYLQGQKDGLEWAAQLAEANHPQTGDWLYDDPIELARAIRKGTDMPPAQTALVVDADDNFYSWFGREWHEHYQHNQYTTAAKQMLGVMAESAWKAGRSVAMLQAGNSPVTPDAWIPVSERMPERDVDVQVYCADKKEQMVGYMERNETEGWFRFASLPNGCGVYCKPTHWMPLPAAPQQDVKSALEHGMQRYAGAMQKLADAGD